jgi:ribonuclease G
MPDIEPFDETQRDEHDELRSPPSEQRGEPINATELNAEARQRAKKLPILQRIMRHFTAKSDTYRELIINSESLEKRVALLTNGVLEKYDIERKGESRMVGAVFKGRIQNLENGLKAAFVDIGQPKNAFLHYWDMLPAANDSSVEFIRDNESEEQKRKRARYTAKDIPQLSPSAPKSSSKSPKTKSAPKARARPRTSPCPGVSSSSCPSADNAASRAKSKTTPSACA